jgi:hypothetical protein
MNKTWANVHYVTNIVRDDEEGWIALELARQAEPTTEPAARIVFWDAEGQFAFEMCAKEIPLSIVEEFIAEAKHTIKVG